MTKSSWKKLKIELSDDSLGDTPVPMPNTEVKTQNAGSSWGLPPVRYGSRLAKGEFSSAGRASALQAEGQRFDPVNSHCTKVQVPQCSGYHVALSRRRSRVRFPSGPFKLYGIQFEKRQDSLAQLVEQLTFNQWVAGSSPARVICGFGGIGRRTRFRIWRFRAWGFKSLNPHIQ